MLTHRAQMNTSVRQRDHMNEPKSHIHTNTRSHKNLANFMHSTICCKLEFLENVPLFVSKHFTSMPWKCLDSIHEHELSKFQSSIKWHKFDNVEDVFVFAFAHHQPQLLLLLFGVLAAAVVVVASESYTRIFLC